MSTKKANSDMTNKAKISDISNSAFESSVIENVFQPLINGLNVSVGLMHISTILPLLEANYSFFYLLLIGYLTD
jgi:hypothetical protein